MTTPSSVSIRFLGAIVTSAHLPRLFEGIQTHDGVRDFIAGVIRQPHEKETLRRVATAALPTDYAGNSLEEFDGLYDGALRKGFDGQAHAAKKDKKESPLGVILLRATLHHDRLSNGIIRTTLPKGGTRCMVIGSQACGAWIRQVCFAELNRALRTQELGDLEATLHAKALHEGTLVDTALRVSGSNGSVYIDLGDSQGTVVAITQEDWRLTTNSPAYFLRTAGQQALPEPKYGGNIHRLKMLLRLDDGNWHRLLGFLLNALRYAGPFMCLLIEGEQGSGKSLLAWAIKSILDPNTLSKQRLTDNERDLMITAQMHYVPVFDNVSGMKNDISDALCTLATGGGFATRKLYTNDEQQVFNYCRAFVINGISDFAGRPDLLERAILIRLPELDARREETDIVREFNEMLPEILGSLYTAVSTALAGESTAAPPVSMRMADAARWITAGEMAFGLNAGTIVNAIAETQADIMTERAQNDVVVSAISKLLESGPIEDTIGELHATLVSERPRYDRAFPSTPAYLSRQLKRLKPVMAKVGMHVEFLGHGRSGTKVRIWVEGQEGKAPRSLSPNY